LVGEGAALGEAAPGRQIEQRRRLTLDGVKALHRSIEAWHGVE
jgi:hypothetical protein